jgi:Ni,Fe-hydrogenase III large subunit
MSQGAGLSTRNGQSFDIASCPVLDTAAWRRALIDRIDAGGRIVQLFGRTCGDGVSLTCVLAFDHRGELEVLGTAAREYASLTPDAPEAHWFERELFEQWGVRPVGHPWLKPIRFETPRRAGGAAAQIGVTDFFRLEGDEAHEVAVGPVHAGVIEPGHFRFQCAGETVHHLEISLGYQHRGVERAMIQRPLRRLHYAQTLAGDTTIAHATAYCRAMEHLGNTTVPPRAQALRGVSAELERLANHIGDLGAMAGDVGFLPTMSYCGRIRGDALNMTAVLCGNRFGRGLIVPGGVACDLSASQAGDLLARLDALERDAASAVGLMLDNPSVLARLEGTGAVSAETAEAIGLVGVAARACGVERDVRMQHPYGLYRFATVPVATWHSGDCFARAYVRWLEVERSIRFVREQLQALPAGDIRHPCAATLPPGRAVVALVEGWRGEVCHMAITDDHGELAAYKVVDPSFHNWFGLAMSLREQQISDFPLCNKSFNLSYCGHDL